MEKWDGTERRSDISYIMKMFDDHTKIDDERMAEVSDKIHELDNNISKLIVLNTETLKNQMLVMSNLQAMVNKHNDYLFDGKSGVAIRVDRLEGLEESRKWTFRVMWGAIVSFFLKIVYDFIKQNK